MNVPTRLVSKTLTALLPIALIVAWAFANFMHSNRFEDFLYSQLAQYYLFMTLAFVVPVALGMLTFPARRRAIAVISYLGTAALFLLPGIIDAFGPAVRQRYIIGPVLMVAVLAGLWLQGKLAERRYVRGFALTFFLLMAMPLTQLAVHQFTVSDHQSRAEVSLQGGAVRKPNVYFILLDAYARADQLQAVFGFDNEPFLDRLRSSGFFIAEGSLSSYPTTTYSIGSTFRMNYAKTLEPNIRNTIFKAAAFQNFRRLGYRRILMPQNQDYMTCPDGFECIFNKSGPENKAIGSLGRNLLGMLPAVPTLLGRFAPDMFAYKTNELPNLLQYLKDTNLRPPTFLYAHFDMPHAPYIRDAKCGKTPPSVQGDRAQMGWGTKEAYIGHLRCGNRQVLKVVDTIIKKDPQAIVILQSDHGSFFRRRHIPGSRYLTLRNEKGWFKDALMESFGTLNAWRLPDGCRKWLSPDLSPINTFRLVFGCLTDSNPEFLRHRGYWVDDRTRELQLIRESGKWIVPIVE